MKYFEEFLELAGSVMPVLHMWNLTLSPGVVSEDSCPCHGKAAAKKMFRKIMVCRVISTEKETMKKCVFSN